MTTTTTLVETSIPAIVAELNRLDIEVREAVTTLSDAQANWQPDGGRRWSVRQNIEHMAATNRVYVAAMRKGLARARRCAQSDDLTSSLGPWGRWFLGIVEPPPRVKAPAPRNIQPPSTGSLMDAIDRFLASQDVAREFARTVEGHDLRATFPNPFFGLLRVRLATGLLVVPAHDRRHLWQLRQVISAPDFPKA